MLNVENKVAIALAVLYAVSQPDDVDVNEIIVRLTARAF